MRGEYSTKQRDAILAFLRDNNAHVTAADITFHLRQEGLGVSTATVYRTLDKFEKEGIVKKMVIGEGYGACYQLVDGEGCHEHFHLKCIKCGRLIHLSCEFMHEMEAHIFEDHGFTVSSGRTVIYGVCSGCNGMPEKPDHPCTCKIANK